MPPQPSLPEFVRGLSAAGVDSLRAAAGAFADWQLAAPLDLSADDPAALAAEYARKLRYPEHVFDPLDPGARDRVAAALDVPTFEAFARAQPDADPDDLPFDWERDVLARLCRREAPPPPAARAPRTTADHASQWPELASLERWRSLSPDEAASVTAALARALGEGFVALPRAGDHGLPRVRSEPLALSFVAVPGGSFAMGLTEDEEADLHARVAAASPESARHVPAFAPSLRPVRRVAVRPFLCAETPLLATHRGAFAAEGDDGNAHAVLRMACDDALAAVEAKGLRVVTEAEWEWVARAGGARAWLFDEGEAAAWAEATVQAPVTSLTHPFGVLALGWGEWVDDGWHPTYEGAPADGASWEPRVWLQTTRGGALAYWPWQGGGEMIGAHAAAREPGGLQGRHAVRAARDLPAR
ncbi:MAG: hypothetical protein U0324_39910 [Polyangiales bacterium]